MRALLAISDAIDAVLAFVAKTFVWFYLALILVICTDVVTRKFGLSLTLAGIDLGSTRLQELEWHLHAVVFLTWLGYAYIRNAHVRIDIATAGLSERKQAWFEVLGCVIFALPYLLVALPFAHDFFMLSLTQNESSSAPNGLPYRWVVKAFLYYGFWSVLFAVISVMLRRLVFLLGSPDVAAAAGAGGKSGH